MVATKLNIEEFKAKVEALEFAGYNWNKETRDLDEVIVHPTVFIDNNALHVSGEDGHGLIDYYGEFHSGYQWIHPRLEAFATLVGGFWEWRDGGCIGLYF